MGYMGFGMRKEVYTRKPKSSFGKLKKIYGEHLENYGHIKKEKGVWSEKDKADFRRMVTNKIRNQRIEESTYNFVIFISLLTIVGFAIYFALK